LEELMAAQRALIAVVNDEQVFLSVLQEFLWQEGYAVSTYSVDAAALHCLCSHPPALILLDINPALESRGVDLLDGIQRDPILAKIPTIVMSVDGRFLAAHEAEIRARGGDTLAEPFNLDDLQALVNRMLATANAAESSADHALCL
jgi:DNA-binding NtrC family response regulator